MLTPWECVNGVNAAEQDIRLMIDRKVMDNFYDDLSRDSCMGEKIKSHTYISHPICRRVQPKVDASVDICPHSFSNGKLMFWKVSAYIFCDIPMKIFCSVNSRVYAEEI